MIQCPGCQHENLEGTFYCEECGTALMIKQGDTTLLMTSATRKLNSETDTVKVTVQEAASNSSSSHSVTPNGAATAAAASPHASTTIPWEPKIFKEHTIITLLLSADAQRLELPLQEIVVVGRADERSSTQPDLDLNPYGAVEKGVSRRHALFVRGEGTLKLIDENSANGSYVNGQRILPKEPRIIRDGDELRFAKMSMRVFFK